MNNLSLQHTNHFQYRNSVFNTAWLYIMPVVSILALVFADWTSLFSYGYAILLLLLTSHVLCRKEKRDLLFSYHFYLLCAITFYLIFKSQFPLYLGMTGEEGGIGTDDCRFYAQVVGGEGVNYTIMVSIIDIMPYSLLLKFLYPFNVHTPLNILIPSLLFTAYLPIYARRFAILLTNDRRIGKISFIYTLLCPFTLYFGCIILRESFTALMVVAGLCFFIEKKYAPLLVCIIALTWIRFGTLVFLICGMIILYRFRMKRKTKTDLYFFILIITVLILFYLSFTFLQEFTNGKLESGLIRTTEGARYEDTTIGALMKMPFPLNIFLSTLFFIFIPIFGIPHLQYGHYLVSSVFQGFLTPLFMFFLWKHIFNASLTSVWGKGKLDEVKQLFYITLVFAMALGTISMQSRHKTVLFPIMCVLAAYGYVKRDKNFDGVSAAMAIVLIVVQVALAFISALK